MSFINSLKKTFRVGNHNKAHWLTAAGVYGESIANELYNLGGEPTSLMTDREITAYNVLVIIRNSEDLELRTLPRMTDKRKAQLEKRREIEKTARNVIGYGDHIKWSERLEEYKHGMQDFNQGGTA